MNKAGDPFLAAAGLATDVHRCLATGSLSICLRRSRMGGESPSKRRSMAEPGAGSSKALVTSSRRRVRSTGLVRKSNAPAFSALIAVSRLPKAVIMATGTCG
ncbi:hypothetical protein D9M71_554820 [compost metagenome]